MDFPITNQSFTFYINGSEEMVLENQSKSESDLYLTQKDYSDQYVRETLIPSIVYTCILFVIGVPGNALVTYIYFFKLKRKPFSAFIVSLAVFDLLNCLISMPTEVAILLNFFVFDHSVICKLSRFVTFYMNAASCIVLLAIAIARFKAICCPLSNWKVRANCTVAASLVFSALTCWPALLLYGTSTFPIAGTGISLKTCLIDDNYRNTRYPDIHSYYLLGTHVFLDLCFIILYSLIGIKVFRQRNFGGVRRASRMSSSSLNEDESNMNRGTLFRSSSRSSTKSFPEQVITRTQSCPNANEIGIGESLEPFIASGIKLLDVNYKKPRFLDFPKTDSNASSRTCLSQSSEENLTLERIKRFNGERSSNKKSLVVLSNGEHLLSAVDSKRELNKRSPSLRDKGIASSKVRGRFIFFSSRSTVRRTLSTTSEHFVHGRSFTASRTAKMLFAVTLLFLLTFLPYCVIVIIRIHNPNFSQQQTNIQKTFYNLFLRSYMLSSALNPVIYNFYNNRFRTESKKLLKTILCFLQKWSK